MSKGNFSDNCSQSPIPEMSPCSPIHPQETLQHQHVVLVVSCWVTAPFFWVLVQAKFCLCPPRLEFLVLWKSCNQILLAFKVRLSGDSQPLCWVQVPRLGSLACGSELSKQWESFFGIMVIQFAGHSPGRYGIWLHYICAPPAILLQLLLCLWTWGIFFW